MSNQIMNELPNSPSTAKGKWVFHLVKIGRTLVCSNKNSLLIGDIYLIIPH